MTYQQAFADWSYLWETYGEADDMTGGYVDQNDLRFLLLSPTKTTAKRCLERQIAYWFDVGPDATSARTFPSFDDPVLVDMAERYKMTERMNRWIS